MDVVDGYPAAGTAFIGLLAIVEKRQGEGLGRAAYRVLERFARDRLGARKLRLAVVATNPVHGFWRRMGFVATGEVRRYRGETVESTASVMEKVLDEEPKSARAQCDDAPARSRRGGGQ